MVRRPARARNAIAVPEIRIAHDALGAALWCHEDSNRAPAREERVERIIFVDPAVPGVQAIERLKITFDFHPDSNLLATAHQGALAGVVEVVVVRHVKLTFFTSSVDKRTHWQRH